MSATVIILLTVAYLVLALFVWSLCVAAGRADDVIEAEHEPQVEDWEAA